MSLINALVAARKAMEPLVKDKTADTGKYRYKYTSLDAILDVVVPALLEQGVLLIQDASSNESVVRVEMFLQTEDSNEVENHHRGLKSRALELPYDGTAQGMGKAITTLRRYQLLSFLGMAPEEDEGGQPSQGSGALPRNYQQVSKQPAPSSAGGKQEPHPSLREAVLPSQATGSAGLELLRGASRRGQNIGGTGASQELQALAMRARNADAQDAEPMATAVAPGKKMSMYGYYLDVVETVVGKGNAQMVLSFLYGRLVSQDSPMTTATQFLFNEIAEGRHKKELGEARTLVAKVL